MANIKECTEDRAKRCAREEDKGYDDCARSEDHGYSQCTQQRDDGYKSCCDWIPCKWACRTWVWVSHIICVVSVWISNIVCVVWTWIKHLVCVLWVYLTAGICLIPVFGRFIIDILDTLFRSALQLIASFISFIASGGGILGIITDFITHPGDTAQTIISLFGGCPSARADVHKPLEIIAHHGMTSDLPENTIQSCRRALLKGANALEIDLCMTSDGEIILWHDWDPDDPVTLGRILEPGQGDPYPPSFPDVGSPWRRPTIDLTLAEFRAHYSYKDEQDGAKRVRLQAELGKIDTSIPTLPEFLLEAGQWEELQALYLDIKMPATAALRYAGPMAESIRQFVSHLRMRRFDVVLMVPDSLVLKTMKARADEKQLDLLFTWDIEFPPALWVNPADYSAIDHATYLHNTVASVGLPRLIPTSWRIYRSTIAYDVEQWNKVNQNPGQRNAGKRIDRLIAWTINDKEQMRCLAQMGVSGIITDKIDDLKTVAKETDRT